MKSSIRNEIKAQIIRAGYTMQEVVDLLHNEYGWSDSVSNLSGKRIWLERQRIQSFRQIAAGIAAVSGSRGAGRCAGVRCGLAETEVSV